MHVPYNIIMCPMWLYRIFPHYLTNGKIFGRKSLNIKRVFWFSLQLLSEHWNISHPKQYPAKYHRCAYIFNYPLFLSEFNTTWNFDRFSKNTWYWKSWKSIQWSWVVLCRWTDMTKLTVTFRNFVNVPKNWTKCTYDGMVLYLDYKFKHTAYNKQTQNKPITM